MNLFKIKKVFLIGMAVFLMFFLVSCANTKNSRPYQHSPQDRILDPMQRGKAYYDKGSYSRAEREFLQVLKDDPQDTDARYMLGVIYCRKGEIARGRNELMQVIAMDSFYSKAYYNLGALYANEGPLQNIEKAAILFRRYLELDLTSKNRTKIKAWLDQHDSQGRVTNNPSDSQTLEQPSDSEFKNWLQQQSETLK